MNIMHKGSISIENEMISCKQMHYRLSRRFKRFSDSVVDPMLTINTSKGRTYYSEVWFEEGVKKKRYLGSDNNNEVFEIKERRFLRKAIAALEERMKFLDEKSLKLNPLNFEEVNNMLPKVYRLTEDQLKEVVGPDDAEKWYNDAVREKARKDRRLGTRFSDNLLHKAKDGTLMRSKSEVLIANELLSRGIPYVYEMPLNIKNHLVHPDFMFYSYSRMRPIIWEHAGMMGDTEYMSDFSKRMDTYLKGGYVPCVDIIFTFDTVDGRMDTRMIDDIIDEYR